jgi:hypothetical protein
LTHTKWRRAKKFNSALILNRVNTIQMEREGVSIKELGEEIYKGLKEVGFNKEEFKKTVNITEMEKFALGEALDFGFSEKKKLTESEQESRKTLISDIHSAYNETIQTMASLDQKTSETSSVEKKSFTPKNLNMTSLDEKEKVTANLDKLAKKINAMITAAANNTITSRLLDEAKREELELYKNGEIS